MVTIDYQPIQKIVVHEILKTTYDNFLKTFMLPGRVYTVRWIDGVLFEILSYPKTPDLVRENIHGIIHWELLNFTKFDKFIPEIKDESINSILNILDNSDNEVVGEAIKWLKKQPIWNE